MQTRQTLRTAWWAAVLACLGGCESRGLVATPPELVWGQRGGGDGEFQKPRAIAIDRADQLYIVDKSGRIQVFDANGKFVRGWQTPETYQGKPTGLGMDREGHLLVADTHYFRVLTYTSQGQLLAERTIGGVNGFGPGQFAFVTDVAQDSHGFIYAGEYGENDRIQKFTSAGEFVLQWGAIGSEPGEFKRPQSLIVDGNDHLWIADACNHRIQVFDATGSEARLVRIWGEEGEGLGQLRYPYGLELDGKGHVYVAEWGNNRVQKFTLDGEFVASWGASGRKPGEMDHPWALARDSRGRLHVLDSENHRVQRIRL